MPKTTHKKKRDESSDSASSGSDSDSDVSSSISDSSDSSSLSDSESSDQPKRKSSKKSSPKKSSKKASPKKKDKKSPQKGKKRKAPKKKKDPNRPKKATTGYMAFNAEMRPKLKLENPKLSLTDSSKKIGELWKAMSDSEKAPYMKVQEKDQERYKKEMAKYTPPSESSSDSDSDSDSDAKHKSKKRKTATPKKKEKDPNAPKRATTAYMCFCAENRAATKANNPTLKPNEMMTKLAELWNALDEDKKKPYLALAAKDKERHAQELANYNKTNKK